jgi:uncharacterized protein YgiM (DUF1202 family)
LSKYDENRDSSINRHTITSSSIDQLSDVDSRQFIDELTATANKISYLKWFVLFPAILSLIYLLSSFGRPATTTYDKKYIVKVDSSLKGVNIRLNPEKNGKVLGTAYAGDKFDFIDSSTSGWQHIAYSRTDAYVARQFTSLDSLLLNPVIHNGFDIDPVGFQRRLLIGTVFFLVAGIFFFNIDRKRLAVEIHYEMDEKMKYFYEQFLLQFSDVRKSQRVWQYLHSRRTNGYKYTAGAGSLIDRISVRGISINKSPVKFLKTNIKTPNIRLKNTDLYFFPERLVIKRGNKFAGVFYKHLKIENKVSRFIEDEVVPSDAEVVDHTWRYLNKNGSPDRRFKDNRRLPICLYSEYTIRSDTGVYEVITTSKKGSFDRFTRFLVDIGQLQRRMPSVSNDI